MAERAQEAYGLIEREKPLLIFMDIEYEDHSDPVVSRELRIEDMIGLFGTLPKRQREDLEAAQHKGNMSKVRKIAKEIEGGDGFNCFGKRLQNLAQQYQLDALN